MRRVRPALYGAVGLFVLSVVLAVTGIWVHSVAGWWWPLVGLALVGAVLGINELRCRQLETSIVTLSGVLLAQFRPGGTPVDQQRLATIVDRLSATFGLNDVDMHIVSDSGYNAALVPREEGVSLIVTDAVMREFELIEIEGVVAHLMARERLNALARLSAASLGTFSLHDAHELAGVSIAYRADEVAAAGIRYPQGLANALAKCAEQTVASDSYFASSRYGDARWVWFNMFSDRPSPLSGDLDEATVRSAALAEW
jgi:Zn-dependent protease with chaperone function